MPISRHRRPLAALLQLTVLISVHATSCVDVKEVAEAVKVIGMRDGTYYGGSVVYSVVVPDDRAAHVILRRDNAAFITPLDYTDSEVGHHTLEATVVPTDPACRGFATKTWSYTIVGAWTDTDGPKYVMEELGIPAFQRALWQSDEKGGEHRSLFSAGPRGASALHGAVLQVSVLLPSSSRDASHLFASLRVRNVTLAGAGEDVDGGVVLRHDCDAEVVVRCPSGTYGLQLKSVRGIIVDSIGLQSSEACDWGSVQRATVCGVTVPVELCVSRRHTTHHLINPVVQGNNVMTFNRTTEVRVEDVWRLPSQATVVFEAGASVRMAPRAVIVCDNATLLFKGSRDAPITVASDTGEAWSCVVALAGCTIVVEHTHVSGSGVLRPDVGQLGFGHHEHHASMFLMFPTTQLMIRHSSLQHGAGLVRVVCASQSCCLLQVMAVCACARDGLAGNWRLPSLS